MKPLLVFLLSAAPGLPAADYVMGADRSFLKAKPGLQILKDHGYTWIRLGLFHNPTQLPNSLEYTIMPAKVAGQRGFKSLLDYHCSDTWAEPGRQFIPKSWKGKPDEQIGGAAPFGNFIRAGITLVARQHPRIARRAEAVFGRSG
jgi:arabinogalactan endo-1,4-beta-galactosidase